MSKFEVRVRKITNIDKHPNAERLSVVRVDSFDWDIISGLDQFKIGDLAIYVPIDSVLPPELVETIFKDSKVKPSNGRIRAAKIRGIVSYGLLVDLSVFNNIGKTYINKNNQLVLEYEKN